MIVTLEAAAWGPMTVWYQVREEDGNVRLTGGHDVDQEWLAELRTPAVKVGTPSHLSTLLVQYLHTRLLDMIPSRVILHFSAGGSIQ